MPSTRWGRMGGVAPLQGCRTSRAVLVMVAGLASPPVPRVQPSPFWGSQHLLAPHIGPAPVLPVTRWTNNPAPVRLSFLPGRPWPGLDGRSFPGSGLAPHRYSALLRHSILSFPRKEALACPEPLISALLGLWALMGRISELPEDSSCPWYQSACRAQRRSGRWAGS